MGNIKSYLDRAAMIVGDRISNEIAHDDAVVEALNQGSTIEEALAIGAQRYPGEALQWDNGNIGDIAAHYDFLREHAKIMKLLKKQGTI